MPDDPDTLPTTDGMGLLTLSPKGKAPESRIKDYSSACGIVRQAIDDAEYERQDRINEQALLDGQGPFIQEDLDRAGLSWCQNNDYGGASSKSEQAQAPYGELFNGFTVEFDDTVQGSQRSEYSARIAESWSVLHSRFWKEHYFEDQNLTRLSVNFGVAVADFEHPRDWRWRAGGLDEHFFPRPMQAYADAADWHIRVRPYRAVQLQAWLDNPNADKVGFNKDAIRKAIDACNRSSNYGDRDDTTNNLFARSYSSRNAFVRLFTMRVVEFTETGKMVSECMGMTDGRGEDFIYKSKKPDWQDSMSDCLVLFTSGIGNGDLHSIKGLARKVFPTEQTINQFINKMYDYARLSMSPQLLAKDANDMKRISDITWGSFATVLPPGLVPNSTSVFPNYANSVLPLINFSGGLGQRNTGVYQPELTPASVEQTREEVITRTMNNGVMTSRALDLYQEAKERQYNLSLKRLQRKDYNKNDPGFKERKMFFDDMKQRGIDNPEDVFSRVTYIKPNRQVGGGSAAGGQMLLEKAAGLRGYLDPVAQKVLDEMVLTRLLGSQNAKILIPQIDIQRTPTQQRFAMDENSFFLLGMAKPVLSDDDHFLHAQIHDRAWQDVGVQFGQGSLQPPQYLAFLNAAIQHQRTHLQALQGNKQLSSQINQFSANLNKAVMAQEHLTNSEQKQRNVALQQAQAQALKQQQGGGIGGDQLKLQARAQQAQLDLNAEAQQAALELNAKKAAHQLALQQAAEKHAQQQSFRDSDNANKLLTDARQPMSNPVIQP